MRAKSSEIILLFLASIIAFPCAAANIYLTEVAPYAFAVDGKSKFDGINVRVVNELRRRSGVSLDTIIVPSSRHLSLFPQEKNGYSISNATNFTDSEGVPLAEVTPYPIVVVASPGIVMKNYDDLISLSNVKGIGMLRRMTYASINQDNRIKKVDIVSLESGFLMMDSGRISGLVGSQPAIFSAAEKVGLDKLLGNMMVIGYSAHVLRSSPDNAKSADAKALTQAMSDMKKDGTLARILSEFQKAKN